MINIDKLNISENNKDILKNYQSYLLTIKHLSDNSIISYVLDIFKYLEYLKIDCTKIKKDDIINYLELLNKEKYLTINFLIG